MRHIPQDTNNNTSHLEKIQFMQEYNICSYTGAKKSEIHCSLLGRIPANYYMDEMAKGSHYDLKPSLGFCPRNL